MVVLVDPQQASRSPDIGMFSKADFTIIKNARVMIAR